MWWCWSSLLSEGLVVLYLAVVFESPASDSNAPNVKSSVVSTRQDVAIQTTLVTLVFDFPLFICLIISIHIWCVVTLHTVAEVSCVDTSFCYLIFQQKRENRALESDLVQDLEKVMEIILWKVIIWIWFYYSSAWNPLYFHKQ